MFTWQDAIVRLTGSLQDRSRERIATEFSSTSIRKFDTLEDIKAVFPGVVLSESPNVVYFATEMCHSLPAINKRRRCFTPRVLAKSHHTMRDNLIDIEHELRKNGVGNHDNVCGYIKGTAIDTEIASSSADIPASSIPLLGLGVLFARHAQVPEMLIAHLNNKSKWATSVEYMHKWEEAELLCKGEFIPFKEAPAPMLEGVSRATVMPYKGHDVSLVVGGRYGFVGFSGLGMTEQPADVDADVLSFFTAAPEYNNLAEIKGASEVNNRKIFLPLRYAVTPKDQADKISKDDLQVVDTYLHELASLEVIGHTEPADDKHVHEVASDGTILPAAGHVHWISTYILVPGTKPRFTGKTSDHTYYPTPNEYQNGVSHLHLLNISLRQKSSEKEKEEESSTPNSGVEIGLSSFQDSFQNINTGDQALDKILQKLNEILTRISSGNSVDAVSMSRELASLRDEIGRTNADEEFKKRVEALVAERITAGDLVTKQKYEQGLADAVSEKEAEIRKQAEAAQKISDRLTQVKDLGLNLEYRLGSDDGSDPAFPTIEEAVRSVSPDDEKAFTIQFATLKQFASSVKAAKAVKEEQVAEAANAADKAKKRAAVLPLVGGGVSSGKTAEEIASESAPEAKKRGLKALTVV